MLPGLECRISPSPSPMTQKTGMNAPKKGLKLYVRRVFITDDFEDMLPSWLSFVRGVIDSDDVPINVSREMLQESRSLRVIKKKIIRKVLEMVKNLAADADEAAELLKDVEDDAEDADGSLAAAREAIANFDSLMLNYGASLKLGVVDDFSNRNKILKVLRWHSSNSDELTTLEGYVERMKEGQERIYYIAGESLSAVEKSPALEALYKRGYEVLYMVDPIDEYVMGAVNEFDGKKFANAAKEDLDLGDEEVDEEDEGLIAEAYKPVTDFLKNILGSKITKATISRRLENSPCTLVTSSYGYTANMERIMKAQALMDPNRPVMTASKTLEINPRHPIIVELNKRLTENPEEGAEDATNVGAAHVLYDTALITSGFSLEDNVDYANRIHRMVNLGLNLEADAPLAEEPARAPKKVVEDEEEEEVIEVEAGDGHDHDEL